MRNAYMHMHDAFVARTLAFGHCLHGIDRLTDVCDRCHARPMFWSVEHWFQRVKWWQRQWYRIAVRTGESHYSCFNVSGWSYPAMRHASCR